MVEKLSRKQIQSQTRVARAAGRSAQREPWWPIGVCYERSTGRIVISFRDGKSLAVPSAAIQELDGVAEDAIERVELQGDGIRWDALDLDVSVPGLISDWLGPRFSTAASGGKGGRSRSVAKAAAARANGAKGGRPRRGR